MVSQRMLGQIGKMNVLAVSGGRVEYRLGETVTVVLPVAYGYRVEVEYRPVPDTYEVRRVLVRGLKRWVKGEASNVYATELGDTVYRASCDGWGA